MRNLLFGAAYYPEYMPYARINKDMEMMKRAGMNTLRIAESTWSSLEPEDGRFDFSTSTEFWRRRRGRVCPLLSVHRPMRCRPGL